MHHNESLAAIQLWLATPPSVLSPSAAASLLSNQGATEALLQAGGSSLSRVLWHLMAVAKEKEAGMTVAALAQNLRAREEKLWHAEWTHARQVRVVPG